jgi:kynureninase
VAGSRADGGSAAAAGPTTAELLARRPDYPVLARGPYLASHTLGAMHRDTPARLASFAELWQRDGVLAWDSWFPELRRVADLIAVIIGAPPGATILRQNVADAMVAVVSAVPFVPPRNRVVVSELDWPGTSHLLRAWARYGAELVTVPADPGGLTVSADRLADAVDARTALVSLSLVAFRSAALLDPRPVIERAHRCGAVVCLDAYQAVGVVPFDVTALRVDYCLGGSVKYLCGGPGNGWLYVRPDLAEEAAPAAVGWLSGADPFGFADRLEYAPGVGRFLGGTPGVAAGYAAAPGYQAVVDIGLPAIRRRSVELTGLLVEEARQRGLAVRSPLEPDRRGGHVTIDVAAPDRVYQQLLQRGIVVDVRPDAGLRVGPHFYSTAEECRHTVATIAELDAAQ